jgi:hypothetical protein
MSPVMSYNKNSHVVSDNSKEKMVREPMQIHPPEIPFPNCERPWPGGGYLHEMAQLSIEFVC